MGLERWLSSAGGHSSPFYSQVPWERDFPSFTSYFSTNFVILYNLVFASITAKIILSLRTNNCFIIAAAHWGTTYWTSLGIGFCCPFVLWGPCCCLHFLIFLCVLCIALTLSRTFSWSWAIKICRGQVLLSCDFTIGYSDKPWLLKLVHVSTPYLRHHLLRLRGILFSFSKDLLVYAFVKLEANSFVFLLDCPTDISNLTSSKEAYHSSCLVICHPSSIQEHCDLLAVTKSEIIMFPSFWSPHQILLILFLIFLKYILSIHFHPLHSLRKIFSF